MIRISVDLSEANPPLRAVEPPWATSDQLETYSMTSPRASKDLSKSMRGTSSGPTLRHSKSSKAALPWPQTQVAEEQGSLRPHRRKNSFSSANEPLTDPRRNHATRPSTSSSMQTSRTPTMSMSHLSVNYDRPISGQRQPAGVSHSATPSLSEASATSLPILPTHAVRTTPRPPPTAELPPTPTTPQTSGSSLPARPHLLSPPFSEHHPLRSRSGTAASASSVSFASSLSTLSFNSRPSPQDPPVAGASDYPSLLNETLPVPRGEEDTMLRRGNNFGLSMGSHNDSKAKGPAVPPKDNLTRHDQTPMPAKTVLPKGRPLPRPLSPSGTVGKRERTMSAVTSPSDGGKTLRKQRSFHNTSLNAPAPLKSTLRHYNSFDPSVVSMPGFEEQARSPPLPPLGSPSLSLPQDLPPLPPLLTGVAKRASAGKDSIPSSSPRRKLFGANKHDRDKERGKERRHELDHVDTSIIPMSASSPGLSTTSSTALANTSSWFDDRGTGSEPASASSVSSPSTGHDVAQHIVPPAELLRLGAAWQQEGDCKNGLRRTKSSWGSRDSDISHTSNESSSSKTPIQNPVRKSSSPLPSSTSKLPRSTSLLYKTNSAPSFSRPHGAPPDLSFAPSSSPLPPESYTSLSPPPPRRQKRSISRLPLQSSSGYPPRRTPSSSAMSSRSMPPKGALIERKPSFLDMSATSQSVTIDVPEVIPSDQEEYEPGSFLELSRGMDSIDTIRESISSLDSFMQ